MIVDGTGYSASVASVAGAIRRAAQATGASFDYLLAAAKVESNLNPNIKATTSSASGLFQFIEQTWLSTLKSAGHALGYGRYADAIVQTPSGGYDVPNPAMRSAVLGLRNNPAANAAMAGAFTQHNSAELRDTIGRPATGGELYIAHFLGAGGAAKLINQARRAPNTPAAGLFPGAAEANRSIFYDRQGHARSVADVYGVLVGRFDAARTHTAALTNGVPARAPGNASEPVPDTAGITDAFAMVSAVPVAHGDDNGPALYSLFQTGGQRQPVSPVVGALWGGNGPGAPTSLPRNAAQSSADSELRRLFQDGRGDIRGMIDGPT
jgi:hypothetical protein